MTDASITHIDIIRGRRNQPNPNHPVTSVRITIELTAALASRLPAPSKMRPLLGKGIYSATSTVRRNDTCELVLVYYMADRPFDGADATDIPQLALRRVHAQLNANKRMNKQG